MSLNREREGGFIPSRGYRNAKSRQLSARAKRDERLVELVGQIHASNYSVYGVRKMWHALKRHGVDIGRA
ncbi:IS3 family transposase [Arcanobacterium canis]